MDTWDDKATGEKRSKFKVQADRVQFLGSRKDDAGGEWLDGIGGRLRGARPSPSPPTRTSGRPSGSNGTMRAGPRRIQQRQPRPRPPDASPPRRPVDSEDDDDIPF